MTPEKIEALRAALPTMGVQEKLHVLDLLEEWEKRQESQKARSSLLTFVKRINPQYKVGPHHRILAQRLEKAARGEIDRLATAIAPRFGKSLLLSLYFPAWFMGNFPDQKLIISSHTADLAVDFGRKVRNLIDSKEYKAIFPGVSLSADSKSAGRWTTGEGGEFFACLRHHTQIYTDKGPVSACEVRVGDTLFNSGKPVKVLEVYKSVHEATYNVAGLDCSAQHPIWTLNRGWVEASEILSKDILRTASFWDRMESLFWRAHGYLEHSRVPSLVQHQVSLRESPQREVPPLWGTWNYALRKMAELRQFLCGHGQSAFSYAHSGQEGQRWLIQPRELRLGDSAGTGQQSQYERVCTGQNTRTACTRVEYHAGSISVSTESGCGSSESGEEAKKELETYSPPENIGWAASFLTRIVARSSGSVEPAKSGIGTKGYLESCREAARIVCGFLLGVRTAGTVRVTSETSPFVNFLTDGDHTFFANGVLTHNCGVGGAVAGRGADLLIIDDPFSEQDVLNGNYDVFDKVYEWYAYGARTRLMPGGRVVILHTRWAKNDLIGRVIEEAAKNPEADQWDYIEFPAIMNEGTDNEKSLWPEQWPLEALKRTRATMPMFQWLAQYQQAPTAQQGALIKKEWWRVWKHEDPPECEYILMSLDAAQEANKRSDFTALTTWGVFYRDEEGDGRRTAALILLNSINKRLEFPQLKDLALKEYRDWEPDCFIIEKKSNGAALAQEMRRMGIPIQEYTPVRGGSTGNSNNKTARVSAVADIVRSGLVWVPEYKWAEEVVEQCNDFPSGKNDDLVDTVVMALMRFRNGGFISLPSDEEWDRKEFIPRRRAAYY